MLTLYVLHKTQLKAQFIRDNSDEFQLTTSISEMKYGSQHVLTQV